MNNRHGKIYGSCRIHNFTSLRNYYVQEYNGTVPVLKSLHDFYKNEYKSIVLLYPLSNHDAREHGDSLSRQHKTNVFSE